MSSALSSSQFFILLTGMPLLQKKIAEYCRVYGRPAGLALDRPVSGPSFWFALGLFLPLWGDIF
jgi:hypothetical protein